MTRYICTAGTSIATPFDKTHPRSFAERIEDKIRAVNERSKGDLLGFLVDLCAETNGLARCDCGPADSVVLLASDTDDGMAAAEAVSEMVKDKLGAAARAERVAGLQVKDLGSFRQEGVRNLLLRAITEVRTARAAGETP